MAGMRGGIAFGRRWGLLPGFQCCSKVQWGEVKSVKGVNDNAAQSAANV
jgi:hypothetical protein